MKKFVLLLVLLVGIAGAANAYNPMRTPVRLSFPQELKTAGAAAQYLMEPLGYQLKVLPPAAPEALQIARTGISPLARTGAVVPLEEALLLLVGNKNRVVIDHEHHLFTFEAVPAQEGADNEK